MSHSVCLRVTIMLAALLVQGLGGHNFFRWNYHLGAALATSCSQFIRSIQRGSV